MRRFAVALMLLASFGLALPAGATTTRIEFSGTQQVIAVIDPGEAWSSGPIRHVRGFRFVALQTPDPDSGLPAGTSHSTVNFNLDSRTLQGRVWGEGVLDVGHGGFRATFQGSIRPADVPGGLLGEFQVVGHGFGSFEGMQLRGTVEEFIAIGAASFQGEIFMPGDR